MTRSRCARPLVYETTKSYALSLSLGSLISVPEIFRPTKKSGTARGLVISVRLFFCRARAHRQDRNETRHLRARPQFLTVSRARPKRPFLPPGPYPMTRNKDRNHAQLALFKCFIPYDRNGGH